MRKLLEFCAGVFKSGGRNHPVRLAIAALRRLLLYPRIADLAADFGLDDSFNRRDLRSDDGGGRGLA